MDKLWSDDFLLLRNNSSQNRSIYNPFWRDTIKTECSALTYPEFVPGLKYDVCVRAYRYDTVESGKIYDIKMCGYYEEIKKECEERKGINKTCMLCDSDYCNNSSDPTDYIWIYSHDSSNGGTIDDFLLNPPPSNASSVNRSIENPLWVEYKIANCSAMVYPEFVPGLIFDVCVRVYIYDKSDKVYDHRLCAYKEEIKHECETRTDLNKTCMLCDFDYCNNSSNPQDYFWIYARDTSERLLPKRHWCIGCLLIFIFSRRFQK